MALEIKGTLPPSPWDALRTTINSLVAELGEKSISYFEVHFEVREDCPLRSMKLTRVTDTMLEVVVRTTTSAKELLPSEFILGTLGWELVNDGKIRWRRIFGHDALLYSVTTNVMLVPESAYQLKDDIWFAIESDNKEIVEQHTKNLWHYMTDQKLLCLPGQNSLKALEAA